MSDTVSTSKTQAFFNELADDRAVVEKALAAYRKDGTKGLMTVLPEAVKEIQEDVIAGLDAAPEIKAGYKTTEFWLVAGVLAANLAYVLITGKALPIEVNVVMGTVTMVYTVIRGLVKKQTPAA